MFERPEAPNNMAKAGLLICLDIGVSSLYLRQSPRTSPP